MNKNIYESKWSQVEKRLNLRSIGAFIKYSGDVPEVDRRSFIEREEAAYKKLAEYLESVCGKETAENMFENIIAYSGTPEDIHFALGMKTGAQIIIQLTGSLETDF